jgi:UDP-N-acetyl-D-glucosamine dehydrogenase
VSTAPAAAGALAGERSMEPDAAVVSGFDAVLVATVQPEHDLELVARHARLVVDARGALRSRMSGDERWVGA